MSLLGFARTPKHTMDEALVEHKAGCLVLVDVREDSERARRFAPGVAARAARRITAWKRHGLDTTTPGRAQ